MIPLDLRALMLEFVNDDFDLLAEFMDCVRKTTFSDRNEVLCFLGWACANGREDVVRELRKKFRLSAKDARFSMNASLIVACENGHLEIVRCLIEEFGLNEHDVRDWRDVHLFFGIMDQNTLLQIMARWYGPEVPGFPERKWNSAIEAARQNGHSKILEYLETIVQKSEPSGVC